MDSCKEIGTPLNTGQKLSKSTTDEEVGVFPYREAIGSIMYLMLMTRPDLAASVQILSRFMEKPTRVHWEAIKRVLRYIQGTKEMGLKFQRTQKFEVAGYCDSDWGGCLDTRRSTSGYVFLLGGAAVSWSSKRQTTVAMSSAEAEYVAATHAAKEAIWIKHLFGEIYFDRSIGGGSSIRIFCDSESAIQLSKNSISHARTKHIDLNFHFIRELVENGSIEIFYVSTNFQVADSMTKAVPKLKNDFCREKMGFKIFAEIIIKGGC